jgi:tripartite-type tricarboxylate transporter receptor subunit TctC
VTHVPYKGPALAAQDLIGGAVPFGFLATPVVMPHVKSGKLVATLPTLVVTHALRTSLMPPPVQR